MAALAVTGQGLAKSHNRVVHYALWSCIQQNEGAPYSTNPNGHYNILQMTYNWGRLNGNPNNYTPTQIMEEAEYQYKQSNYSRSWLIGQWLRWDGAYYCLKYAI